VLLRDLKPLTFDLRMAQQFVYIHRGDRVYKYSVLELGTSTEQTDGQTDDGA